MNLSQLHHGEEPPFTGTAGSGTVFFSGCNMRCCYCQNYKISKENKGKKLSAKELSKIFLKLQSEGAHNLNLVTPTPHLAIILEALGIAKKNNLNIPIIYNTSGFEKVSIIRLLKGLIDIYLPDYKYAQNKLSKKFSITPNYTTICRLALTEMYKQVGPLQVNDRGLATKGMLIRHLILPNNIINTKRILMGLISLTDLKVWIGLMGQYNPIFKSKKFPELNRKISFSEYQRVLRILKKSKINNGFIQNLKSSSLKYLPKFIY